MTIQPRFVLVRTMAGKLRLDFDGQPLDGILNLECVDSATRSPAEIIVTLDGRVVDFTTETSNGGES